MPESGEIFMVDGIPHKCIDGTWIPLETEMKLSMNDPVNHPNHYISKNGLESIEVIKSFTEDLQGFEAVATANALKYLMRWKNKNGIQDLEKAKWYITELLIYEDGKMADV